MAFSAAVMNTVNGQTVEGSGDAFRLVNPATGEAFGEYRAAGTEQIDAAFDAAAGAFRIWKKTPPAERQRALLALADLIDAEAETICELEVAETGKPRAVTMQLEIRRAADQLRFFAGLGRAPSGLAQTEYIEGFTSSIRREPIGVIAQVVPWNYPFMMSIWKIAPALAAGNTVVLKPAETTPSSAAYLAQLAQSVLPHGVFNLVLGGREVGRALSEHPGAQMVALTGSVRAGSQVMHSAADRLAKVHLELGGKAPAVVFEDADIESAVAGIAQAAFFNSGQDCTAATRAIVHESVHDEFLDRLVRYIGTIVTAGPDNPAAFHGPLNSEAHLIRVREMLARVPEHVTSYCTGVVPEQGFYLAPTVLAGVQQDDEVVQQELFAPVLTVQSFRDEEHAIELANGVDMALTASIWTKNHGRATALVGELEYGTVWVNTHQVLPAEMPHGGFKTSGIGKDLSLYGYEDYTRIKHVMSAHTR